MSKQRLTDAVVKSLPLPEKGNKVHYDGDLPGFGVRVTAAGARAFVLNYRTRTGRERRYTIGSFPAWKTAAARKEAEELKRQIDTGADPVGELKAEREAPTVAKMIERFEEEHLPKLRPGTATDYRTLWKLHILPVMRHLKVVEVRFEDVDALHRKMTKAGHRYQANRAVALLSKMFNLAIRWGWRADNPASGIERNSEEKRERYLSAAEIRSLADALNGLEDAQAANIIRLLMLTGARRGEVLAARWEQFDLTNGVWTKPSAMTKQKKTHRVPLSAPARQLLADLRKEAPKDAEFVFPGRHEGHRQEIKRAWATACIAAGICEEVVEKRAKGREVIVQKPTARIHDLRHSYASVLAGAGMSLPIIGALLGHTQPATTQRYAHLLDDPLRQATERAGSVMSAKDEGADVTDIREARR